MKRFTAFFNDGTHCNIQATRMELKDDAILVYDGAELVGYFDVSTVCGAHLSERKKEEFV